MSLFKNANADLITTATDVYVCPAGKVAIIHGAQIANVTATTETNVTVQWTDASDSDKITRIAFDFRLEGKLAFNPLVDTKLVLEAGDKLQALAADASVCEMTLAVLEQDVA